MNTVITIGRQYGSGGRDVGYALSKILNIPFYDNKIIEKSAEDSAFSEKMHKEIEKRTQSKLFYPFSNLATTDENGIRPLDELFEVQSNVILKLVSQGPCVLVGRCADYVLKEHTNIVNIFIYAEIQKRSHRITDTYKEYGEINHIKKVDRQRAAYYNYYTGGTWGNKKNYNLCIDTTKISVLETAKIIQEYVLYIGEQNDTQD